MKCTYCGLHDMTSVGTYLVCSGCSHMVPKDKAAAGDPRAKAKATSTVKKGKK